MGAARNFGPSELLKIDCTLRMTPGRLLARCWSEIIVGSIEGPLASLDEKRKGRGWGERSGHSSGCFLFARQEDQSVDEDRSCKLGVESFMNLV